MRTCEDLVAENAALRVRVAEVEAENAALKAQLAMCSAVYRPSRRTSTRVSAASYRGPP